VIEAIRPRLASRTQFVRFAIDLRTWEPPRSAPPAVQVRQGLYELVRLRGSDEALPSEFYLDRLRGGRRPYLGFVEGRIGHISWLFTSDDRPRLIALGPDEIELDGAFTLPAARGRGLLTAVECAMLLDAKREGYARAYTHVAVDNVASLRGVAKTGFSSAGVVTLRWTLGLHWISYIAEQVTGLPL
jgi:ribosomal protein S18 acetylase RimI-like enzyme